MTQTNYDKIDIFADIMEPAANILADSSILGILNRHEPVIRAVKQAFKHHKDEVIEILARIEGVEPEDYQFEGIKVMFQMLAFLNKPEILKMLREVFTSSQKDGGASSGSATENTGESEN